MSLTVNPSRLNVSQGISKLPSVVNVENIHFPVCNDRQLERLQDLFVQDLNNLGINVFMSDCEPRYYSLPHRTYELNVRIQNPKVERDERNIGENLLFKIEIHEGEETRTKISYGFERRKDLPQEALFFTAERHGFMAADGIINEYWREFLKTFSDQISEWECSFAKGWIDSYNPVTNSKIPAQFAVRLLESQGEDFNITVGNDTFSKQEAIDYTNEGLLIARKTGVNRVEFGTS